jgi:PAS domain S-box-containing protein
MDSTTDWSAGTVGGFDASASYVGRMLGSIPDSICFVGFTRQVQRVNQAACQLLAYESSELRGIPVERIIQDAATALPFEGPLYERLMAQESVKGIPITFLPRVGAPIPAEANCSLIRDQQGRPTAMVVVAHDLRDEQGLQRARRAEEELRRSNAALESQLTTAQKQLMLADRLAAVGTLTAGIAHEINNPLAYVLNNLEVISTEFTEYAELVHRHVASVPTQVRFDLQEKAHAVDRAVTVAIHGVLRVCETIRNLRTFARADTEARSPVDIHHVLDIAVDIAFPEIKQRALVIKDYGPKVQVEAAEGRLCQVFVNLLINAAQSIPPGDPRLNTIRLMTHADGGMVSVQVHDSGGGIPKEILDRIFDPFFTTKPVGEGSGLGLSICYGIVKSLGGDIRVESEAGKGSTFTVVLPAKPLS